MIDKPSTDESRPPWPCPDYWDRVVRLSRARERLGYPNRTEVRQVDGAWYLCDEGSGRKVAL